MTKYDETHSQGVFVKAAIQVKLAAPIETVAKTNVFKLEQSLSERQGHSREFDLPFLRSEVTVEKLNHCQYGPHIFTVYLFLVSSESPLMAKSQP